MHSAAAGTSSMTPSGMLSAKRDPLRQQLRLGLLDHAS